MKVSERNTPDSVFLTARQTCSARCGNRSCLEIMYSLSLWEQAPNKHWQAGIYWSLLMSYLAFRYLMGRQTQAMLARLRWLTAVQYPRLGCEGTVQTDSICISPRSKEDEHEQITCRRARSISHGVQAIDYPP